MGQPQLEETVYKCFKTEAVLESDNPAVKREWLLDLNIPGELPEDITAFELAPGGRYLFTGDSDGWVRCWDLWSREYALSYH